MIRVINISMISVLFFFLEVLGFELRALGRPFTTCAMLPVLYVKCSYPNSQTHTHAETSGSMAMMDI
jgi:hypothetical protein